jgi:hypothetical protein
MRFVFLIKLIFYQQVWDSHITPLGWELKNNTDLIFWAIDISPLTGWGINTTESDIFVAIDMSPLTGWGINTTESDIFVAIDMSPLTGWEWYCQLSMSIGMAPHMAGK